jgi:hypothetical protein
LALFETEEVGRRIMANFTQAAESRIPVATLPPLILAALAQLF